MTQYTTGTVTTDGTATVTGSGTSWSSEVTNEHSFVIPDSAGGDGVIYDIASVDSDTQITLAAAYAGANVSGAAYAINRDYTSGDNLPELPKQAVASNQIVTRLARAVQTALNTCLRKSDNLNSVASKATARDNLDLFSRTELTKAVGNIHNPLTDLDLKSAAGVRSSKFAGDFQFLRESDATETDRYGVLHKTSYYSGTPSATDSFSIDDSAASFGDLTDYVIYVTDGSSEAYRWVDANSSTKVIWDKPVAFTPTSYKISKPRFEEDGMLIEGSSENLLTYSEQFDNVVWTKGATAVVTADAGTAPDGTTTADKVEIASSSDFIYQGATVTTDTAYTASWWVYADAATSSLRYGIYDATNGAWIDKASYSITTSLNRMTVEFTTPATCTSVRVYPLRGDNIATGTAYLWGTQLEELPFASSYIPTTSAAVTRAADKLILDWDKNHPQLTAGTPFSVIADAKILSAVAYGADRTILSGGIGETGADQYSLLRVNSDATWVTYFRSGSGDSFSAVVSDISSMTRYAISVSSAELVTGDADGEQAFSSTRSLSTDAGVNPTLAVGCRPVGTHNLYGHIAWLRIYDYALTDTEMRVA